MQQSLCLSTMQQAEHVISLQPLAVQQHRTMNKSQPTSHILGCQFHPKHSAVLWFTLLAVALIWLIAVGKGRPSTSGAAAVVHADAIANVTAASLSAEQSAVAAAASVAMQAPATSEETSDLDRDRGDDGSGDGIQQEHNQSPTDHAGTLTEAAAVSAVEDAGQQTAVAHAAAAMYTPSARHTRCNYGSLPGTWMSDAPVGSRWQVLDPDCQLTNWLAVYHTAALSAQGLSGAAEGPAAASSSAGAAALPAVSMLMLSDSVDRYIMQHACDYLQGVRQTNMAELKHMRPPVNPPGSAAQDSSSSTHPGDVSEHEPRPESLSTTDASAAQPSSINMTAYAFHTCEMPSTVPIKVASSYFPGVHVTGPFHRNLSHNFMSRVDSAASMWEEQYGVEPPQVVGVASALWDIARMWLHEQHLVQGPELSRPLLDSWMANFTAVLQYSKQQLPHTQLWLTHTTMLPAHDVVTGDALKPYLGRRYYIEQLNAAAVTVAQREDMQWVDYASVSSRFREGQKHLVDLIHPNADVALEVFNVLLNMAIQQRHM